MIPQPKNHGLPATNWFPTVSKWRFMDFVQPQYLSRNTVSECFRIERWQCTETVDALQTGLRWCLLNWRKAQIVRSGKVEAKKQVPILRNLRNRCLMIFLRPSRSHFRTRPAQSIFRFSADGAASARLFLASSRRRTAGPHPLRGSCLARKRRLGG